MESGQLQGLAETLLQKNCTDVYENDSYLQFNLNKIPMSRSLNHCVYIIAVAGKDQKIHIYEMS